MRKLFRWRPWLVGCLLSAVAAGVQASDISPALKQLLQGFLAQHPAAQAARADLERAEAEARATAQPLYNPEVEFEYEDATDVTKSVGLAQTLDWSGKRRARETASRDSIRAAQAAQAAMRQTLLGELLGELSGVTISSHAASLAQQRVQLLDEFLRLAERRYAAGDVGQTDVDLARLALSEARMQAAAIVAEATAAESRLTALVQRPAGGWPALPVLPADIASFESGELLQQHPALRQAQAEAAAAKASVYIAERERRPDPTVGLRGGQEDDDTLVGVMVSIPLFVRNTFRAEVEAANAHAIRAEQVYYNRLRRAKGELQAAAERYRLMRSALSDWERVGQRSLKGRVELLKRLWEAGETSTTDYLVQLQQTLDTQTSAVELRGSAWAAWITWLTASGQAEQWLGL